MTSRHISIRRESWPLARPFAISRGTKTTADVIVCEITQDGFTGRGECVPYGRYGETLESVELELEAIRDSLSDGASREMLQRMLPAGAARNAADCALWDMEAKLAGMHAWRLAGLAEPQPAITAFTISLGSPDDMGAQAEAAHMRPLLKLKLGADHPVACVAAVRQAAPRARLIADANEGWSFAQLREIAPELTRLGLELVEQPVPSGDDAMLSTWQSPIILCADESCHVAADIPKLAGRYGAVNIKLDKTGGFTEALASVRAAEQAGLKIMVGCMVATSLAMAPAALLAGHAAYVDLDGPLLLKNDRQGGLRFEGSLMHPPARSLWG
jgi:L-alanine-DL-glutamate epimerase-like enolase superfamily enzyme